MRIYESDLLTVDQIGSLGGEAFLACTAERSLLYDSGFAYSAPALVAELEELLEGRANSSLDYLFLSHSHYDHASGSVWIKERWPAVTIFGHALAARALSRPGARATILELNKEAARDAWEFGRMSLEQLEGFDYAPLERLAVDQVVAEGDLIDMGGGGSEGDGGSLSFEVLAAPGHTRCSLMLWCARERLLFGNESLGVIINENMVAPAYLTGYQDSLDSIDKALALQPEHVLASHQKRLSGPEATRYLANARHWAQKTAHFVWECRSMGLHKDEIVDVLKLIFFKYVERGDQPEAAFDLNNMLMVELLLAAEEVPPGA
jgi:glyoxylase-like metal-dependent hydrolase (beta-lactamase superfamily II)